MSDRELSPPDSPRWKAADPEVVAPSSPTSGPTPLDLGGLLRMLGGMGAPNTRPQETPCNVKPSEPEKTPETTMDEAKEKLAEERPIRSAGPTLNPELINALLPVVTQIFGAGASRSVNVDNLISAFVPQTNKPDDLTALKDLVTTLMPLIMGVMNTVNNKREATRAVQQENDVAKKQQVDAFTLMVISCCQEWMTSLKHTGNNRLQAVSFVDKLQGLWKLFCLFIEHAMGKDDHMKLRMSIFKEALNDEFVNVINQLKTI